MSSRPALPSAEEIGQLVPIGRIAKETPYTSDFLRQLARSGKIRAYKLNRDWLTTPDAIREYLKTQTQRHEKALSILQVAEKAFLAALLVAIVLSVTPLARAQGLNSSSPSAASAILTEVAAGVHQLLLSFGQALLGKTTEEYLAEVPAPRLAMAKHAILAMRIPSRDSAVRPVPHVLGLSTSLAPILTASLQNQIQSFIDQILQGYLAAGKFTGPAGPQGPSGLTAGFGGPNGSIQNRNGQTTSVIGGTPIVSYLPASSSNANSGGSLAGFATLSANTLSAGQTTLSGTLTGTVGSFSGSLSVAGQTTLGTSTATSLTVSGPAIFSGSTTIAGLTVTGLNPGLTQGSVTFQGVAGLAQDNGNFFYDSTNHRLGLGTTTPVAKLAIQGASGGNDLLDVASSTGTSILHLYANPWSVWDPTPAPKLSFFGDIEANFTGPNQTRLVGIGLGSSWQTGDVSTFQLGDSYQTITETYGGPLTINSYHGNVIQAFPQYGGMTGQAVLLVTSQSSNSSGVPILITKGVSGQTADIFQVQNSASTTLFNVTASGKVGIGTASPQYPLDVQASQAIVNLNSSSTTAMLQMTSYRNSSITHNQIYGLAARGTQAAPLAIQSGDALLSIRGNGYGTTQFENTNDDPAAIDLSADGAFTDTSTPGKIVFYTMAPGATFKSTRMVINSAGNIGISSSTPSGRLVIQGSGTGATNDFIFTDSSNNPKFVIADNGNVGIGTTTPTLGPLTMASGAYVSSGGTWTNASDRNLKENFARVTPASILEKIDQLPVTQWDYKTEGPTVNHIGPVAQDFWAAFHLGNSSTSISTIDPAGIALLGIQALDHKITALQGAMNGNASTPATLTVYNPDNFSGDSVGEATILAGRSSVRVTFGQAYRYQPIVTITLEGMPTATFSSVNGADSSGFTIQTLTPVTSETTFAWHSFASPAAKLFVSDGSTHNITLIAPAVPQSSQQTPSVVTVGAALTASSSPASASLTPDSGAVAAATSTPPVVAPSTPDVTASSTPPAIIPTPSDQVIAVPSVTPEIQQPINSSSSSP